MDKFAIQEALELIPGPALDEIQVFDEIDSTNLEAIRRIKGGQTGTRLLVARSQSAGRGRRGRHWLSPVGGVYLSLSKGFTSKPDSLQALSLVSALSVLVALQRQGAAELQLKWPNDILHRNRKLAGVLLELVSRSDRNYLVFGVGVNLNLPAGVIDSLDRPITDLASIAGGNPEPVAVIAEIVSRLLHNIQVYQLDGFAPFQEQWNRLDCFREREIVIQSGDTRLVGKALGVDGDGALVLQTAAGRQLISGGEIFPSLRDAEAQADL